MPTSSFSLFFYTSFSLCLSKGFPFPSICLCILYFKIRACTDNCLFTCLWISLSALFMDSRYTVHIQFGIHFNHLLTFCLVGITIRFYFSFYLLPICNIGLSFSIYTQPIRYATSIYLFTYYLLTHRYIEHWSINLWLSLYYKRMHQNDFSLHSFTHILPI